MRKKQLISEGKLDKHGKPNENTPAEYMRALAAAGTPAATAAAKDDAEPVRPLLLTRSRVAARCSHGSTPFVTVSSCEDGLARVYPAAVCPSRGGRPTQPPCFAAGRCGCGVFVCFADEESGHGP